MKRQGGNRSADGKAERPGGRCPVCGRPRVHRYRPFCSAACRDRDFLAWVEGRFAIPAFEEEPDEEQGER